MCKRGILAFMAAWLLSIASAQAQDKACAVVMLHGKWGNPQYVQYFARKLDPPCDYKSLEMPWSQRRGYDAPYAQAIADIAAQVRVFRDQGYRRVLLAGHSFGGNAALAYMTEVADVDGVIALAPGHGPRLMYENGISREGVDKARALVAEGKGAETVTIQDLNTGQRRSVRMRADVAVSYFDPDGLGDMPLSATRWKRAVPVLWLIGQQDIPNLRQGPDFIFNKLPLHPASRFLEIPGTHVGMLDHAGEPARAWIQALP